MQQVTLTLPGADGLHARPAARLVQVAAGYRASVRLEHAGRQADARSLVQLLGLGVRGGSPLRVSADGPDEGAALAAVLGVLREVVGSTQ
jgi:phosphotransferase system HPr (HPr) family protein